MDSVIFLAIGIIALMFGKRPLKLNSVGINLIKQFEGFSPVVYLDAAGHPTIGYGHLIRDGESFTDGISTNDAHYLMLDDVKRFEDAINQSVTVPLSQSQFNSLVSFAYNVGVSAFENSTLLGRLNAGDYIGATEELERWNRAGGRVLAGLVNRRKLEQDAFWS